MLKKVTPPRSEVDLVTFADFVEFMDLTEVIARKCFSNGTAADVIVFLILDDNSVADTLRKFKLRKRQLTQLIKNFLEDVRAVKKSAKTKLALCEAHRS